jgi:hypothetical protein
MLIFYILVNRTYVSYLLEHISSKQCYAYRKIYIAARVMLFILRSYANLFLVYLSMFSISHLISTVAWLYSVRSFKRVILGTVAFFVE